MTEPNAAETEALGALIFEILRTGNALVVAGDALMAPLGLTSARWQVLGTLAHTGPQTVSDLARRLSLSRQSVQRVVDQMAGAGLLVARPNPAHRRAPLIALTAAGAALQAQAEARRLGWTADLAARLDTADAADAARLMRRLRQALAPRAEASRPGLVDSD
jgi:DNA-binding MarR family transcriptional regulator